MLQKSVKSPVLLPNVQRSTESTLSRRVLYWTIPQFYLQRMKSHTSFLQKNPFFQRTLIAKQIPDNLLISRKNTTGLAIALGEIHSERALIKNHLEEEPRIFDQRWKGRHARPATNIWYKGAIIKKAQYWRKNQW